MGAAMSELRQRQPRIENPKYLKLIRQMPCVRCGCNPCGEAAHLRLNGDGKENPGMGAKPDDAWTLPLCRSCHAHSTQHGGKAGFGKKLAMTRSDSPEPLPDAG